MADGWGTAVGTAFKWMDRWSDPRKKREALLVEKQQILQKPQTDKLARRLSAIDLCLLRLQRDIERRAS